MSRQEDFEKAAMDYCEDYSHCIYYEAGAEYGYQYAKKSFFDALTHCCNRHGIHPNTRVELISHLQKSMEE